MAVTLNSQIQELATQIGKDVKALGDKQGNLASLTTIQKASLVLAINELKAALDGIDKNLIDDATPSDTKTYSSNKIINEISTACQKVKNDLIGGAGDAFDTLKELADLIVANKDLIESLQQLAGAHVRYDADQELTPEQKAQARKNIGAADTETVKSNTSAIGTLSDLSTTDKTSLVKAVNEVKGIADGANQKAGQVETSLNTFKQNVGPTDTNFVQIYEQARDGTAAG